MSYPPKPAVCPECARPYTPVAIAMPEDYPWIEAGTRPPPRPDVCDHGSLRRPRVVYELSRQVATDALAIANLRGALTELVAASSLSVADLIAARAKAIHILAATEN